MNTTKLAVTYLIFMSITELLTTIPQDARQTFNKLQKLNLNSASPEPARACSRGHRLPSPGGQEEQLPGQGRARSACSRGHQLPSPGGQEEQLPGQGRARSAPLASRCQRSLKLRLSDQRQQQQQQLQWRSEPTLRPISLTTEDVVDTDIVNGPPVTPALAGRFAALYSCARVEAMAALDALPELSNSEELKSKLLFSVVVLAFRSANCCQQTIREAVRRQLQIPPPAPACQPPARRRPAAGRHSAQLDNTITWFLQQTVETYDLSDNVEEVCSQIWATLYDYPSLRTTEGLLGYVKDSVRLAWALTNQTPRCRIEYEIRHFSDELHVRHQASDATSAAVQTYVWPALMQGATCVRKAVVIT